MIVPSRSRPIRITASETSGSGHRDTDTIVRGAMEQRAELNRQGRDDRRTILRVVEESGRGHVGAAFSAMEMVRVLYDHVLRVDPRDPEWPERDRFIFSKGHGCLALYLVLAEKGFFPEDELS